MTTLGCENRCETGVDRWPSAGRVEVPLMDWLKARYEDEWQHFDARMQVRTAWVEPKAGGSTVFIRFRLFEAERMPESRFGLSFSNMFGFWNQKYPEIHRNLSKSH